MKSRLFWPLRSCATCGKIVISDAEAVQGQTLDPAVPDLPADRKSLPLAVGGLFKAPQFTIGDAEAGRCPGLSLSVVGRPGSGEADRMGLLPVTPVLAEIEKN